MRILAIETSCDDTSMAVVEVKEGKVPQFKVLKNLVSSQTKIHSHWGGVVPNLAKREHLKNLPKVWKSVKKTCSMLHAPCAFDLIAVTVGPGLEPSLWTGVEFAKKLSEELKIPLVGVNHLEGHLYSSLLSRTSLRGAKATKQSRIQFPTIVLLVSGGHTILVLMKNLKSWKKLGETRDDAAGEAYDKVAKMMGLPYPGGPLIEKLAKKGNREAINFPRPMMRDKNYEFSFSGLKTSVLYYLRDNSKAKQVDIAASFQSAVLDVLTTKTIRAVREFGAQSVFLCGGVAANKALRKELKKAANAAGAEFFAPDFEYNTDNAAMIAAAAYFRTKFKKKKYPLGANANLTL